MDKLEICKQTRKFASDSLYKVLNNLLQSNKPISEVTLRDAWLAEMRKNKDIFPDGWYTPPPHGMIVLFGEDTNIKRINFESARSQENWPRNDIFLNKKTGIIFLYASPVDKKSLIIGDFGLILYFGNNKKIQNHLKEVLNANKEIAKQVKVGMTLFDVNKLAYEYLKKHNIQNAGWLSTSDPTGINLGHTIPFTDEKLTKNVAAETWQKTADYISKQRKFVNAIEQTKVTPSLAFTIEPRLDISHHPEVPRSYFHTILEIDKKGDKEFLTYFDDLFTLAGMNYMIEQ